MKEINKRRKYLEMTDDKRVAVWMLEIVNKKRIIDKYVYQSLRNLPWQRDSEKLWLR